MCSISHMIDISISGQALGGVSFLKISDGLMINTYYKTHTF